MWDGERGTLLSDEGGFTYQNITIAVYPHILINLKWVKKKKRNGFPSSQKACSSPNWYVLLYVTYSSIKLVKNDPWNTLPFTAN